MRMKIGFKKNEECSQMVSGNSNYLYCYDDFFLSNLVILWQPEELKRDKYIRLLQLLELEQLSKESLPPLYLVYIATACSCYLFLLKSIKLTVLEMEEK